MPAIAGSAPAITDRLLHHGCTGDDVRAIQDVLNFHLRGLMPLVVDGVFGDRTESRVEFFQRVNGLNEDGIVGPMTRSILFETTIASFRLLFVPSSLLNAQPPAAPAPAQPQSTAGAATSLATRIIASAGSRDLRNRSPRVSAIFGPQVTVPEAQTVKLPILRPLQAARAAATPVTPSVLRFRLTVPTRKDPTDPQVRSRHEAIELIDTTALDVASRGFLIDQVPDPEEETRTPLDGGFKWGADPLFIPPYSTAFPQGKARFTVKLSGGGPSAPPQVLVGAWGEGRAMINLAEMEFETQTLPRAQLESVGMVGVTGTF